MSRFTVYRVEHHVCGVWPLSKVNEWFGPFRAKLLEAGFVLMAYEPLLGNIVRSSSRHQLGFPVYEVTPRRQLPWPELLGPGSLGEEVREADAVNVK